MLEDLYVEVALQAPPSPGYIHGPAEPEQAPPLPDYVPGPEHADDEIVAEDQPYAEDAAPTAQSPEYVPESDFKAYLEEDDDEDPEEDPVDYPADGGDNGDDEEGFLKDDEDDDMEIEADEEEEHPAPADSVVVTLPAADQVSSAEETEPFETDESVATPPPHPAYRMITMISILAPVPVPAWSDSEVARLLAMFTPPSSPLSPLSSPPLQIPFPPLPPILSPPSPVLSSAPPPSPILSPTRSDAPSSGIPPPLPISTPTSSPPLQLPSASRKEDRPEVTLPPRKRLGIALGPGYKVRESSSAAAARPAGGLRADYGFVATMDRKIRRDLEREVGYGITDSWDEIVDTLQGAPISTDTELGGYMREFETRVRRDTNEIYSRLDDEQKARLSREDWVRSMDASDLTRGEVMSLRTTVLVQTTEIRELHVADRKRQVVTSKMLRADHRRFAETRGLRIADRTRQQQLIQTLTVMQSLQRQVTPLQGQKNMAPKQTTRSTVDQETTNTKSTTNAQLQALIDQGVTAALAARDALRSTNGDDSHNSGTGVRRTERATHELKNQVKFATCTLHSVTLTWWNTHVKTVGHNAAYGMPWKTLMKMMTDKYCPQNEIKKLEMEIWDLKNTGRVYTAPSGEKKQYGGSKPLCAKCNYHHDGPCAPKCHKCNKVGHFARDCRSTEYTNNAKNQRGTGSSQKRTCYECRVQGHFKRECPKLKNNNNHDNQGGRDNASAKVYVVGRAGTNPDSNVVTGTFLLNNRYASVLFDTGVDKSFVSTAFSSQINITPSTLDHCYDVELADGRIVGLNTILRGCTLNLLNHPFNINLMPVELGSFDAIIDMDWLAKYQAVIACAENILRIPWGKETLIIHGDGSNQGNATRLNIISYTKTEKYMMKGFPIFLAHVTTKEVEDKSGKKRLEDVAIVQNFPEVFPEDLSGLPPT
nr:putative reverse transcriptase domain-containing protein [Tanacetum cinerariifolium]